MDELQLQLIKNHMALANYIAIQEYNKAPHALELDEMKAIAYYGLVEAAARWRSYCEKNNYDVMAVVFFTKYSSLRIRGAIIDRHRSYDWATRSLRDKEKKIRNVVHAKGNFLTHKEISDATGLTEKEVRQTLAAVEWAPVSLDLASEGLPTDGDHVTGLQIADAEETEGSAAVRSMLDSFADAVRELPYQQRVVVVLHYHQGIELRKIATIMELTDAAASKLHTEAVLALLDTLRAVAS